MGLKGTPRGHFIFAASLLSPAGHMGCAHPQEMDTGPARCSRSRLSWAVQTGQCGHRVRRSLPLLVAHAHSPKHSPVCSQHWGCTSRVALASPSGHLRGHPLEGAGDPAWCFPSDTLGCRSLAKEISARVSKLLSPYQPPGEPGDRRSRRRRDALISGCSSPLSPASVNSPGCYQCEGVASPVERDPAQC